MPVSNNWTRNRYNRRNRLRRIQRGLEYLLAEKVDVGAVEHYLDPYMLRQLTEARNSVKDVLELLSNRHKRKERVSRVPRSKNNAPAGF